MQVKGVTRIKKDLNAIKNLTEGEIPTRRQIRDTSQAVAYFMGYVSGLGFVSVMWSQRRLVSEAGYFTHMYQGISSNYIEGENY